MKIKICGLTRICDIDFVNEAQPDYIGFVFYKKSKRFVDEKTAQDLKKHLNPAIKSTGVFVNAQMDEILKNSSVDIIQLHGDEDENFIKELKNHTDKPVIKAFSQHKKIDTCADYILYDAPCGSNYGGLGKTFDWGEIKDVKKPFFLAGGINIDNIDDAKKIAPYCIDVSSGVETDGKKDKNKILQIVKRIKNG